MKVIAILAAVVFLCPAVSWAEYDLFNAEDYNFELEGRYWKPKLDSTVKIVENDIGTDVKLVDDLGFDEKKDFGEARGQVKFFGKHKFNFSYLPLKWDADTTLTRTIEFNGQTYTAGTRVQSKLEMKMFKGGYEYDLIASKHGFLGLTLDVLLTDFCMEMKAPSMALDEKYDATVPIPMIGLSGRVIPIKWVSLTGKISGLPMGGYGYILDAEASLDINPVKYVGISVGYRFLKMDLEYDDNKADFKLDGPFAALKVRF
ncbi:MAG: hypothetical protein AMJ94_14790 [Deltaproteobacteria bacterium SM23_61]|nr:MAG: hypothetical protein AMJ94_14790 [Deltaproteobacteria bacterium SM23_61]